MKIAIAITALTTLLAPGAALSEEPVGRNRYQVQELAHELEERAHKALYRAESRRHHFSRREARALNALRRLASEAAHFHDQVEAHRQNPYHTADDFRVLSEAFYRASERLHRGHVDNRVRRDFRKIARTFNELAYHVEGVEHGYVGNRHDGVRRGGYYDVRGRPRVRARVGYKEGTGVRFDVRVGLPGGRARVGGR